MTTAIISPNRGRVAEILLVLARIGLGALFLYMGLNKALHPVEFLKLVRQYEALHTPLLLNLVASALPWFEVFCGLLLVLGLAVRGAALMIVAMLIPFTILVFLRALAMKEAGGVPFCTIRFDCGCGAGEVLICRKLAENILLMAAAVGLIFWRRDRLCVRHTLLGRVASDQAPV